VTAPAPLRDAFAGWDLQRGETVLYWHRRCHTQTAMAEPAFASFRKRNATLLKCVACKGDCPEEEFVRSGERP